MNFHELFDGAVPPPLGCTSDGDDGGILVPPREAALIEQCLKEGGYLEWNREAQQWERKG